MTVDDDLKPRIAALEAFKQDFEKKFYAAVAVAGALGLAGIWGGAYVNALSQRIADLTSTSEKLESELTDLQATVTLAKTQISDAATQARSDLESWAQAKLLEMTDSAESVAQAKRAELQQIDADELLAKLRDGTASLNVRELVVSNKRNRRVAIISADDTDDGFLAINEATGTERALINVAGGDGQLTISNRKGIDSIWIGVFDSGEGAIQIYNSGGDQAVMELTSNGQGGVLNLYTAGGQRRYELALHNKRPQSQFWGESGALAMALGVFSDDDKGFVRVFDPTTAERISGQLSAQNRGGTIQLYSSDGRQIVFIGPEQNTGNGLVNVMGLRGEQTNSHSPTP